MSTPKCPHCLKKSGFDLWEPTSKSYAVLYCRQCEKAIGICESKVTRTKNLTALVTVLKSLLKIK